LLLRERSSLVNDLSDYGSELSALTGCERFGVEAEELSGWFACLRQNARHKATDIAAAIQQVFKSSLLNNKAYKGSDGL